MDKKTTLIIAIIIIIIVLGAGGYLFLNSQKKKTGTKTPKIEGEAADIVTDSALKGVLPSLETNPLENKPDINPADKANPFNNIKTNPFE